MHARALRILNSMSKVFAFVFAEVVLRVPEKCFTIGGLPMIVHGIRITQSLDSVDQYLYHQNVPKS